MKQRNQLWAVSFLSVSLAGSQLCMRMIHITKHLVPLNKMTMVGTMDEFQWAHVCFSVTKSVMIHSCKFGRKYMQEVTNVLIWPFILFYRCPRRTFNKAGQMPQHYKSTFKSLKVCIHARFPYTIASYSQECMLIAHRDRVNLQQRASIDMVSTLSVSLQSQELAGLSVGALNLRALISWVVSLTRWRCHS